jgi:4-hydroxy-2-oxoheptanedioate aldolase
LPATLPPARNRVKEAIMAGTPSYVLAVRISRGPEIVAITAATGHDGFYIDLQHSPLAMETVAQSSQAALLAGLTPLVRVPDANPAVIGRVLDAGVLGVIVPDIRDASAAPAVVQACRPPPDGERSLMTGSPQTGFTSMDGAAQATLLRDVTLVIAMIESPEGVAAADEIAAVPGMDALFVGTQDLTAAMGVPGQFRHPEVQDAYRRMIGVCRARAKRLLIGGIKDPVLLEEYMRLGAARCYFTGTDTAFLMDGARRQVAALTAMDAQLETTS